MKIELLTLLDSLYELRRNLAVVDTSPCLVLLVDKSERDDLENQIYAYFQSRFGEIISKVEPVGRFDNSTVVHFPQHRVSLALLDKPVPYSGGDIMAAHAKRSDAVFSKGF